MSVLGLMLVSLLSPALTSTEAKDASDAAAVSDPAEHRSVETAAPSASRTSASRSEPTAEAIGMAIGSALGAGAGGGLSLVLAGAAVLGAGGITAALGVGHAAGDTLVRASLAVAMLALVIGPTVGAGVGAALMTAGASALSKDAGWWTATSAASAGLGVAAGAAGGLVGGGVASFLLLAGLAAIASDPTLYGPALLALTAMPAILLIGFFGGALIGGGAALGLRWGARVLVIDPVAGALE